jgi:serine/threonine protein phosphatase PrpC
MIVKEDFEIAPRKLIDLANDQGGLDNITIITIKNL